MLNRARRAIFELSKIDPDLPNSQQRADSLAIQVSELAHILRAYRDDMEVNPPRLTYVEERLA